MVKKWHVGCFACSVCDKVFVLKFFNYSFVDIGIYFNSKTILLQMLDSTNLQEKDGVLYCKVLFEKAFLQTSITHRHSP